MSTSPITLSGTEKWICLAALSSMLVGNYFAYDIPSALNPILQDYLGTTDDEYSYQIQSLYSIYSFPNIILPMLSGGLLERYGIGRGMMFLTFAAILGHFIFAIGIALKSYPCMLFGRLLFGIGGESLGVAQTSLTSLFFAGSNLSFAYGLNISIARVGSVLNDVLTLNIAKNFGVIWSCWLGMAMCLFSAFGSSYVFFLYQSKTLENSKKRRDSEDSKENIEPICTDFSLSTIKSAMSKFSLCFWLLSMLIVVFNGVAIPFNTIESEFVGNKFLDGDVVLARFYVGIANTLSTVLGPLCGIVQDRYGGRVWYLLVCALIQFLIFYLLEFTFVHPAFTISLLTVPYVFSTTTWPCISKVVPEEVLSLAVGIATCFMNTSLTVFPLIAAAIADTDKKFTNEMYFFLGCSAFAIIISLVVLYVDKVKYKGLLQQPEKKTKIIYELSDLDELPNTIVTNSSDRMLLSTRSITVQ